MSSNNFDRIMNVCVVGAVLACALFIQWMWSEMPESSVLIKMILTSVLVVACLLAVSLVTLTKE